MGISFESWWLRPRARSGAPEDCDADWGRALTTVRPGWIRHGSGAAQRRTDLRTSEQALRHLLLSRFAGGCQTCACAVQRITQVQSAEWRLLSSGASSPVTSPSRSSVPTDDA